MPDENTKAARWIRLVRILAICITTVLLLTTLVFIFLESTWVEEIHRRRRFSMAWPGPRFCLSRFSKSFPPCFRINSSRLGRKPETG